MNINERRQTLLNHMIQVGSAQVEDLASLLKVSKMTVHRDLDALAEQGIIRKVHGGATVQPTNQIESNLMYRTHIASNTKRAIARAAAAHVTSGQAIIIDDSTSTASIPQFLAHTTPLTVITNSLTVVDGLKGRYGTKIICLGGDFNPKFNAFFGLLCEQSVSTLHANTLFMSTSAVVGTDAYHQEQDVVKTKRALMNAVDRRVLLVDSNKFNMTALNKLAPLTSFDLVITDDGISPETESILKQAKINLQIVHN